MSSVTAGLPGSIDPKKRYGYALVVFPRPFKSTDDVPHFAHREAVFGPREGKTQAVLVHASLAEIDELIKRHHKQDGAQVITSRTSSLLQKNWKDNSWLHTALVKVRDGSRP